MEFIGKYFILIFHISNSMVLGNDKSMDDYLVVSLSYDYIQNSGDVLSCSGIFRG